MGKRALNELINRKPASARWYSSFERKPWLTPEPTLAAGTEVKNGPPRRLGCFRLSALAPRKWRSSRAVPNCANFVSSLVETTTVRESERSAAETTARAGACCKEEKRMGGVV